MFWVDPALIRGPPPPPKGLEFSLKGMGVWWLYWTKSEFYVSFIIHPKGVFFYHVLELFPCEGWPYTRTLIAHRKRPLSVLAMKYCAILLSTSPTVHSVGVELGG